MSIVMALVNNFFELRSDAFKITHHNRRPLPMRTDSIGPWLESLSFLTWLAALTNSALVYLFRDGSAQNSTKLDKDKIDNSVPCKGDILVNAVVIALAASYGYIVVRAVVRRVLEQCVWAGCGEVEEADRNTREVIARYLKRSGVDGNNIIDNVDAPKQEEGEAFWQYDEGLDEICGTLKDT